SGGGHRNAASGQWNQVVSHTPSYTPTGYWREGGGELHREKDCGSSGRATWRQGKSDGEGGRVTGARRGGGQGSAVGFNQCTRNGQADARTSVVPVAGAIATVEAFEDVAQLLRCHAFTGIGDFDEDRARTLLGGAD